MESKHYYKLVNITKKKQTHRYREQTGGYQWRGGIDRWRSGRYKLLGVYRLKDVLYNTGNTVNIL